MAAAEASPGRCSADDGGLLPRTSTLATTPCISFLLCALPNFVPVSCTCVDPLAPTRSCLPINARSVNLAACIANSTVDLPRCSAGWVLLFC